jgi:tRNA threonylcarbamoyladenosine biosynthesis protein TsaE
LQTIAEYWLDSEADTDALGAALAAWLPRGTTVALCGTLGAGKTRLARAVATAININSVQVTSPTFTLVQTYDGRVRMHHMDTYRIVDEDEFFEVGIEELCEEPDSWKFIEWADRFPSLLPPHALWLRIELVAERRRVRLEGASEFWTQQGKPLLQPK